VIAETSEVEDWTFMYNPVLRVHLIDTPGFDDTNKKDVEVLRDIAGWLGVTYKKKILLSGLIYLHPISGNRLRGSALRNLFMFKKLCGPECLPGIVLATTMWGLVNPADGVKRETQLRSTNDFWGEMEKGGSRVMRHLRTKESAMTILGVIIQHRHPMLLKIQDEMINEGRGLEDTGAGIKVNEDLIEADRKHKAELTALKEDMKEADEASKREIAELMRKQQAEIDENERQRKKLETSMAKLEEDRARDLEALEQKLADQASNLKRKEKDIKDFQESLKRRENAETLDREEKARLNQKLNDMEQERAKEVRELKAAVEQAQRRKTTGQCFDDITDSLLISKVSRLSRSCS
jgi:predicted  nucleic acid-binding Zn-ribbon protein